MECLKFSEYYYYIVETETHVYRVDLVQLELCCHYGEKYNLCCEGADQDDLFCLLSSAFFHLLFCKKQLSRYMSFNFLLYRMKILASISTQYSLHLHLLNIKVKIWVLHAFWQLNGDIGKGPNII